MVEQTLTKLRANIISSVLSEGLKSAKQLLDEGKSYLGSSDRFPEYEVEGSKIGPPFYYEPEEYAKHFYEMFYANCYRTIPVLAERLPGRNPFIIRPNRDTPLPDIAEEHQELLSQRINSSFLVVCINKFGPYNPGKVVEPDKFIKVIFPKSIWEEYILFGGKKRNKNVLLTDEQIQRRISWYKALLTIPNYEGVIMNIFNERKANNDKYWEDLNAGRKPKQKYVWLEDSLWIHGVRLPTQEDLECL